MSSVLRLHFIDVGFGDSIVIELPGDRVGIIDSPDAQATLNYVRKRLSPMPKTLEFLAATHPLGNDNYSSLSATIKNHH